MKFNGTPKPTKAKPSGTKRVKPIAANADRVTTKKRKEDA